MQLRTREGGSRTDTIAFGPAGDCGDHGDAGVHARPQRSLGEDGGAAVCDESGYSVDEHRGDAAGRQAEPDALEVETKGGGKVDDGGEPDDLGTTLTTSRERE